MLSLLFTVLLQQNSYAVYELKSKICAVGSNCTDEDYNALSTWEDVMDNEGDADLTSTSFLCGDYDSETSTAITDHTTVTWDSGASTGRLIHQVKRTGVSSYYIQTSVGSSLADNDVVTDGTNNFTINGIPDSCQITAEGYDDDGDLYDNVGVSGFTTDEDNYIKITVPEGERHDGTIESSVGFKVISTVYNTDAIRLAEPYSIGEWFIAQGTSYSTGISIWGDGYQPITYSHCIVIGKESIQTRGGVNLYNNVVESTYQYVFTTNYPNYDAVVRLYNNTFIAPGTGDVGGVRHSDNRGTMYVVNNIAFASGTGVDYTNSGYYKEFLTNASSDSTGGSVTNQTTAIFVDFANGDYHLVDDSLDLVDSGTTSSNTVTLDIDGDTRPQGSAWDIGADEYVSSSAQRIPTMLELRGVTVYGGTLR